MLAKAKIYFKEKLYYSPRKIAQIQNEVEASSPSHSPIHSTVIIPYKVNMKKVMTTTSKPILNGE